MQAIVNLPQPVIAAVQGMATAAGCQLVASCDLAIASRTARFCTPGVDIGLFCTTPMVALTRNVAPKHALELLFTGEPVSAEHAAGIGLVNRVVAPDCLRDEAMALARRIAAKPARTVRLGKQAFRHQRAMALAEAYQFAAGVMVDNLLDPEAVEGIGAFVAKRAPRFP
jgi:enoyl-CoA hydratase/carnithine racemase